jgi:hypothetical protein
VTSLRKAARGKPCLIRLPGCTGGGEDTVLCHYRMLPYCGTGIKPPDDMGAFGCAVCHAICDSRIDPPDGYTYDQVRLAHAEAVMRTQQLVKRAA